MNSSKSIYSKSRVGVFVSGFGFSGSSAITDWLLDEFDITKPAGGEIQAFNFGIYKLIFRALGLGRQPAKIWSDSYYTYPDFWWWKNYFATLPLSRHAVFGSVWDRNLSLLVFLLTSTFFNMRYRKQKTKVLQLMKNDPSNDKRYFNAIKRLVSRIEKVNGGCSSEELALIRTDLNHIWRAILSFWDDNGKHPLIFDNAIDGYKIETAIDNQLLPFDVNHVFVVYRDPRDMFVDQLKHKGIQIGSFRRFIKQYESSVNVIARLQNRQFIGDYVNLHVISFEDFVLNFNNLRNRIQRQLMLGCRSGESAQRRFSQLESKSNIGIWKSHLSCQREMQLRERFNAYCQ